ncbi:hypothetical protein BDV25DRAFT_149278 [Aspergillus avenaceus]|uniref:Uncharacterized protein n=1 Tax=Aspergillus avenaceus TaxID=36643 RepID=A0A5N6U4E4_ASPAV|nr:hypothetical protein BDV25DRAFT_149278 [Aspergillus avenaceus]
MNQVKDINTLSSYLSSPDLPNLSTTPVDSIIICASAILHQATHLFATLQSRPNLTKSLVLCGGIGHSTQFMYEAVAQHPRFNCIAESIHGLPEARVLERILDTFFDRAAITSRGCEILIEDRSTNCGLNANLSKDVLEGAGFTGLKTCVVIQDPTMMRRTKASFVKAFEGVRDPPEFVGCPVFVPRVSLDDGLGFEDVEGFKDEGELWSMDRFLDLLLGEVPRLRDDEGGYGPRGKGFIPHVDVPGDVEEAWARLKIGSRGSR